MTDVSAPWDWRDYRAAWVAQCDDCRGRQLYTHVLSPWFRAFIEERCLPVVKR